MLSCISSSVGISTRFSVPGPQSPRGSTHREGTAFIGGFDVLIALEVAVALQKAEAARILKREGVHAEALEVGERAPEPVLVAVHEEQAVGIVDFGPVVAGTAVFLFTVEEHAREGSKADFLKVFGSLAGEERAFHVHDRGRSGRDDEAVGSGHAFTVHERVDGDVPGVGGGLHDPEFLEVGELFALRRGGVQGEAAGIDAVVRIRSQRAEVGRAEENGHFVLVFGLVQRIMQTESGEVHVLGLGDLPGQVFAAVLEQRRIKGPRLPRLRR